MGDDGVVSRELGASVVFVEGKMIVTSSVAVAVVSVVAAVVYKWYVNKGLRDCRGYKKDLQIFIEIVTICFYEMWRVLRCYRGMCNVRTWEWLRLIGYLYYRQGRLLY